MSALGPLTSAKFLDTTGRSLFVPSGLNSSYPVKSGTTVYRGGLVGLDADGVLVPMADSENLYFRGVALSTVTGDGTKQCAVDIGGALINLNYTPGSVNQNMGGNEVYADGDQDCDLSGGVTNKNAIGTIDGAVSSTEVRVKLYEASIGSQLRTIYALIAAAT